MRRLPRWTWSSLQYRDSLRFNRFHPFDMPNTKRLANTRVMEFLGLLLWLACAFCLNACSFQEEQVGLSIVGYNHTTDRSIYHFSVNGNMGAGPGPRSGGGGFSCCVNLPKVWHPGIKVKIEWEYQGGDILPPPPPDQVVEIEVPKYGPEDLSRFAVHFFPDHKVKVLVNNKDIDRPNYPAELRWDAPTPQ